MKVIGNKMVVLKYIVHKCACAEQMQKHQPFGWLKDKNDGHRTLITVVENEDMMA